MKTTKVEKKGHFFQVLEKSFGIASKKCSGRIYDTLENLVSIDSRVTFFA